MPRNTNRAASRHMREIAKARAEALELKAKMYAEGHWPVNSAAVRNSQTAAGNDSHTNS